MDIKTIEKLMKLTKKSNIKEIEIKNSEIYIRIKNIQKEANLNPDYDVKNLISTENNHQFKKNDTLNEHEIKSPIIGTFYNSPAPGEKPFVKIGQKIEPGDVLCIIEAMKVMNRIESDRRGIISKISLKNGTSVEYNQQLFILITE